MCAMLDVRYVRLCDRGQERRRRDTAPEPARRCHRAARYDRPGLRAERGRVQAAACVRSDGTVRLLRARRYFLAAGALGTPPLVLASGLHELNPAGQAVGRHLVRHCSSIVMGVFLRPLDEAPGFHKQIGIHDLYFAIGAGTEPASSGRSSRSAIRPPVSSRASCRPVCGARRSRCARG